MFVKALLVSLVLYVLKGGERGLGKPMFERPLVASAIIGLVLGDLRSGIIIGAELEMVFLGVANIGGAAPSDALTGAVFGTAFAIILGKGTDVALALAVPIGLVGNMIDPIYNIFVTALLPEMDKCAAEGNQKRLVRLHLFHTFLNPLPYAIIAFIAVFYGAGSLQGFINSVPKIVMDCLTAIGHVLPAIGFAMLLNMLWTKELCIYMFFGFIITIYLKLPIIAVSVLGAVIAIAVALRDMSIRKITRSKNAESNVEEGFFNE